MTPVQKLNSIISDIQGQLAYADPTVRIAGNEVLARLRGLANDLTNEQQTAPAPNPSTTKESVIVALIAKLVDRL